MPWACLCDDIKLVGFRCGRPSGFCNKKAKIGCEWNYQTPISPEVGRKLRHKEAIRQYQEITLKGLFVLVSGYALSILFAYLAAPS